MRPPIPLAGLAAATALAVAGCGGGRSATTSTTAATHTPFEGATFPAGVPAPGFALRDQQGRTVSLSSYRGRLAVVAFLSSDCRACTVMAQQIRGALDELASRPTFGRGTAEGAMAVLLVSTNPRTDTQASVRRFLADTALTGRVLYLTGSEAQLRPVWRAYRIPPPSAGRSASEAASTIVLIGPSGNERVAFGLEEVTPERLAHDIRLLRDGRATPAK